MIDCKQKTFDLPFQIKFPWFKVPISTTVQVDITEKQKDFFHVLILHINILFTHLNTNASTCTSLRGNLLYYQDSITDLFTAS